ncbi:MAG: Hsp20/alpha crystallin family protein [candidate division WOR-3 bacterium]
MFRKDLVSYDPLDKFFDIREDFDNVIRDFMRGFRELVPGRGVYPLMDVKEDESKYTVTVEIPGIDKKDIKLKMKDNTLYLEGEKKEETKEKGESYIRVERSYGNFRRTVTFDSQVDASKVKAEFKNGVLTVILPKVEKEKPKEIEVEVK